MIPLWVGAALIGALAQTGRNATQAGLTKAIGTIGATQVRFLFGLPFVVAFLVLVSLWTGEALPSLTSATLGWTLIGGLAQIAGTALMLQVMKSTAFGVTTAWLKIEPVTLALIGLLLLGDPVTLPILLAILIAVLGVVILTLKPGQGRAMFVQTGPAAMGLLAGVFFGLAAIGFRGGILSLETGGFLIRATTTLALALVIQSSTLILWMLARDRAALSGSFRVWRSSLGVGFLGAFASEFWFIGFSLTTAANVRTFALVEVIFAQLVARYWFQQRATRRQLIGMAVIVLGVATLLRVQG
jgi:drug/metabolite transporter (DMT)-like permease